MTEGSAFLTKPGAAGPFGALLDEYGRAAADFCRTVEGFTPADFAACRAWREPA